MAEPTAAEVLMLAMINRARLDPSGEAARYGISLNEGLAAGTISAVSKQPLAFSGELIASARGHSQAMIDRDFFAHNDPLTGSTPQSRATAAGYIGSVGENIAFRGPDNGVATLLTQHQDLFVDSGIAGRGHRLNILDDRYQQIGVGQAVGDYQGINSSMLTEDFGIPTALGQFITGLTYNDSDGNGFYSIGEARGGVTVGTAAGNAVSGTAGAYAHAIGTGTQLITFSGGGLAGSVSAYVAVAAGRNVLVDLVGTSTIETSASMTASTGVVKIIGLGNIGLSLTGNALDNVIAGVLGADTIDGGAGTDSAQFAGPRASYTITSIGSGQYQVSANGVTDTLARIERAVFADATVTLASQQFHSLGSWTGAGRGDQRWYVGDFNGDSRDDILAYMSGVSGAMVHGNYGTGFGDGVSWIGAGNNGRWYVGDFNGDGRDDIFRIVPGVAGAQTFLSNAHAFTPGTNWTGAGSGDQGWYVGDFNGDGKADILRYNSGVSGAEVFISSGSGFTGGDSWTGAGNGGKWYVGDFNGDGKDDVMRFFPGSAGAQVFLSNGSGFGPAQTWLPAESAGDDGWYVGDFNGDGRADIMRHFAVSATGADMFLSSGSGFTPAGNWSSATHGEEPWYLGNFDDHTGTDLFRYVSGVTGAEMFVV